MSRDWTPLENYLVEQNQIKNGYGDIFDFLESLKFVYPDGKEELMHPPEEMALRRKFPNLGRLLMNDFMQMHQKLSVIDGGIELLHQKDAELGKFIESKGRDGDKNSYLISWFTGKLDEDFYHSARNDKLFVGEIVNEALAFNFVKDIKRQLDEKENTTSYGEPQAWVALDNGRSIEVTHEQEGLPEKDYFYSVRLHCTEIEQETGEFENSNGIVALFNSWMGAPVDVVTDLIKRLLRSNDNIPVEEHVKVSLDSKINKAEETKSGIQHYGTTERAAEPSR